jgi:hypothetical protein
LSQDVVGGSLEAPVTEDAYVYGDDNPYAEPDPTGEATAEQVGIGAPLSSVPDGYSYYLEGGDSENGLDLAGLIESGIVDTVRATATVIRYSPIGVGLQAISDATGHTVGICIGGSAQTYGAVKSSICYVATPSGQSGITATVGVGTGLPLSEGANGFIGGLYSNGTDLTEQGGKFGYGSATLGDGWTTVGGGYARSGKIWDAEAGWAPGGEAPIPASLQGGVSETATFSAW